jgi:Ca2+-binding RTX toxin-like protein
VRRMLVPPTVLAVVLFVVPQAMASRASVEPECLPGAIRPAQCKGKLVVTAEPGERNRITFSGPTDYVDSAPEFTVQTVVDRGAPIHAGTGCDQVSAHKVRCDPAKDAYETDIPAETTISTGDGADRVTIIDGASTVLGGSGNDRILAKAAVDTLKGEAGNDRIRSTSPEGGVIEGGRGNDSLSSKYQQTLRGDSGNDRLTGSGDSDSIFGGSGRDRLLGRGGDDELNGGSGRDRISGGGDDDAIVSRDSFRDRVNCGSGRDKLRADGRDRALHCERVRRR